MIDIRDGLEVYRERPVPTSWKVPAFFCNDWIALRLCDLCREIGVDQPFHIAFGAPRSAWSGGRPSVVATELDDATLDAYFSAYAERNLTVALTLSRLDVDPATYDDPYCLRLLEFAERYRAEIILFDLDLADHIRSLHPDLRLICSLNRAMVDYKDGFGGRDEEAYYRALFERFDEVVIRCEFAQDRARLESLSDLADRCEIITNQFCVPNCKNVYRHVSSMENWDHAAAPQACYNKHLASDISCRLCGNLHFSNRQINEFAQMGYTKMKLAGRNAPIPKFLTMMSEYIFEPTGIISFMREELSREYQAESQRCGGQLPPFSLPAPLQLQSAQVEPAKASGFARAPRRSIA